MPLTGDNIYNNYIISDIIFRDAKWSLVSVIALVTVWATWLALVRLLEYKYRDPVCVMALVVSALIVLLCLYARKLYEFTEFGKADTKLELMSNILLSDSPTNSQSGSRTYGTNILPGIIGTRLHTHIQIKLTIVKLQLCRSLKIILYSVIQYTNT